MEKKIESLQGLRALAFIGVFCYHTYSNVFGSSGVWGVSVFLVMSGFLLILNYYRKGRIVSADVISNFRFAVGRIFRLYPLHLLGIALMFIFDICGEDAYSLQEGIIHLITNVLVVQTWFPGIDNIVGVTWYLSTILFAYFMFPFVLQYMERGYKSNKCAWVAIVLLWLVQIVFVYVGMTIDKNNHDVHQWLSFFPIIRFVEVLIGCNLGYLFLNRKDERIEVRKSTGIEVSILLIMGILIFVNDIPFASFRNCFFAITSCIAVWMFSKGEGYISKALTNRIVLKIAELSAYAFIIHVVVFWYIEVILYHFGILDIIGYTWLRIIKLTIGFVITMLLSEGYDRVLKYCISYKKKHISSMDMPVNG